MVLQLHAVLTPDEVREARERLAQAPWIDGRLTAGEQSARAKNNEQLPEECSESRHVQALVLRRFLTHMTG